MQATTTTATVSYPYTYEIPQYPYQQTGYANSYTPGNYYSNYYNQLANDYILTAQNQFYAGQNDDATLDRLPGYKRWYNDNQIDRYQTNYLEGSHEYADRVQSSYPGGGWKKINGNRE